jgi:hypothetical protein
MLGNKRESRDIHDPCPQVLETKSSTGIAFYLDLVTKSSIAFVVISQNSEKRSFKASVCSVFIQHI